MNYLKCDAEDCDHRENIDSLSEDMIGKPCPKCGESLLTEADYRSGIAMQIVVDALVEAGLARKQGPVSESETVINYGIHNGKLTIKEVDK